MDIQGDTLFSARKAGYFSAPVSDTGEQLIGDVLHQEVIGVLEGQLNVVLLKDLVSDK